MKSLKVFETYDLTTVEVGPQIPADGISTTYERGTSVMKARNGTMHYNK